MQVAEAVEDSDTVYYYFECKTNSSLNSGWQTDPCYEVFMGRENQGYSFRVKARDECGNESSWSSYVLVRRCQPNGLCFQKDCDGL